ncbi:MAG TPA: MSMEG_1061 family FMN-dependent PPOX-type flavoprotein [Xanthobacteraceae bacterium]|nr:MSMEG_1061 family FMN-dependent PPOX-type flavoprotein [Xanthobacteraceae bacterium]
MDGIADLESLRAHFGAMSTIVAHKVMPRLDRHSRAFIALSPFLVLATADGHGGVDASPRGDAPGFVAMRDDTTLIIPDRPGNRRVDSFSNVLRQPGIGLIFFVPGIDETLRVNGTGRIVTDAALLAPLAAHGKIPATGLLVSLTEVFFHCGKALIRSKLWDPSRHVARDSFPTLGRIVAEQTAMISAESAEQFVATSYREKLY